MERIRAVMGRSRFLAAHETSHLDARSYAFHHLVRGGGEPVVLVHGGGVWLYSFRHLIGPLSEAFRVHALDMPGFGFTAILRDQVRIDVWSMADALKEYLDASGIRKASLVGHSWGGGWVLAFALAYPDAAGRIVLMESSGLDVPDVLPWELLKVPVLGGVLLRLAGRTTARRMLEASFADRSLVTESMVSEILLPLRIRRNRQHQARLARNISWKEVEARLHEVHSPVVLVWGELDRYLPLSLSARFKDRMPGLAVHVIASCGHCPHEERPDAAAAIVSRFLGRGRPGIP